MNKLNSIIEREDMIEFIFFLNGLEIEDFMNMKTGDLWENLEFFSSRKISNYFGFVYEIYDWKETKEMLEFCRSSNGVEIYQIESNNDSYNLFYVTKKENLLKEIFDMINLSYVVFDKSELDDIEEEE